METAISMKDQIVMSLPLQGCIVSHQNYFKPRKTELRLQTRWLSQRLKEQTIGDLPTIDMDQH
jgi:hypothetical protein